MRKLVERLGLDWLVMIWGESPFSEEKPPDSESFEGIESQFGHLLETEKVDDALQYCQVLVENEEKRSTTIESKASALLGISGTVAAFTTAFAALLLDRGKINSFFLLMFLPVLYFLIVASFLFTILLALKVVTAGDYIFTYPSPESIFELSKASLGDVKQNRAVNALYSFYRNQRVVNKKTTYLGGAQLWFRNSIFLLLMVALILAAPMPFRPPSVVATPSLPPSPIGAQQTVMPTGVTVQTPIATTTPTYTPTAFPTNTPPPAVSASPQTSATPKP